MENIDQIAGQFFIIGFKGYSLPDSYKSFIRNNNLGGVIYFKHNVQSPAQLAELTNDIQFSARGKNTPPLFISIDHEGGKINRLVKPFTKFPGNDFVGALGSPKIAFEFGSILGKELKAVGINMNFAPVVDVYTNPENVVIRNRAFSSDPEVCAKMGSAVCRGIQKMGVIAVAKHFPGHGSVQQDSHEVLPVSNRTLDELNALELIPFTRVIRSRVEGILTAHILNKFLDPKYPATLSKPTLTELLRNKLRYNKLIITDDMETMKAIRDNFPPDEAAVLAIQAGCDCLLYRGDEEVGQQALEGVKKAIQDKTISAARVQESLARIQKAKEAYAQTAHPIDVTNVGQYIGLPDHFKLADLILKKELPNEAV